jgi:hypothetical protein
MTPQKKDNCDDESSDFLSLFIGDHLSGIQIGRYILILSFERGGRIEASVSISTRTLGQDNVANYDIQSARGSLQLASFFGPRIIDISLTENALRLFFEGEGEVLIQRLIGEGENGVIHAGVNPPRFEVF